MVEEDVLTLIFIVAILMQGGSCCLDGESGISGCDLGSNDESIEESTGLKVAVLVCI